MNGQRFNGSSEQIVKEEFIQRRGSEVLKEKHENGATAPQLLHRCS